MDYVFNILITVAIFAVLSASFDLELGYTGLFSIAHAAFAAMGAYVAALASINLGVPFLTSLLLAALFCAVAGALLAIPAIRVSGDYLVIASFGFLIVVYTITANWQDLTRGPVGLTGIPQPSVLGWQVRGLAQYTILYGVLATLLVSATWWLGASPFGRALKAIQENQLAAQALGKNPVALKTWVFAIASAMAGIAGGMYAAYVTFINPDSFTITESVLIFAMVILGAPGTVIGPVIGTVLLVVLPDALRFLSVPPTLVGPVRQMIYGLLLVVFMLARPDGLYGIFRQLRFGKKHGGEEGILDSRERPAQSALTVPVDRGEV